MSDDLFNEDSLRADIVSVWGEYGAHVDVFDHMLKLCAENERLRAEGAKAYLDGFRSGWKSLAGTMMPLTDEEAAFRAALAALEGDDT